MLSAVYNPYIVDCSSLDTAGEGFTGATLYMDPLAKMTIPAIQTMGMVYTDEDNAITFIEETQRKSAQAGISIVAKQVKKSDPFMPAAMELLGAGVDSIGLLFDAYYGFNNDHAGRESSRFARENNLPLFAFMNHPIAGALLYIGPDFKYIGELSARQAIMILMEGKTPGDLPVLRKHDLTVFYDAEVVERLGIVFPKSTGQDCKASRNDTPEAFHRGGKRGAGMIGREGTHVPDGPAGPLEEPAPGAGRVIPAGGRAAGAPGGAEPGRTSRSRFTGSSAAGKDPSARTTLAG